MSAPKEYVPKRALGVLAMQVPEPRSYHGWADVARWLVEDCADFQILPGRVVVLDADGDPCSYGPGDWIVADGDSWQRYSSEEFETKFEQVDQ